MQVKSTGAKVADPPQNHDPRIPVYLRVAAVLRAEIVENIYEHGASLPPEGELAARFAVARLTIRRALETLALEGVVARRPGRGHGTRVNRPEATRPDKLSVDGLVRRYHSLGLATTVEVLAIETLPAGTQAAEYLNCSAGTPVISILRRRLVARRPFSVYTTLVPERLAFDLRDKIVGDIPVVRLMEEKGIRITRADQYISAVVADGTTSKLLNCHPGDPLINVRRVVFDENDDVVESISIIYRSTDYHYRVSLKRDHTNQVSLWAINDIC